MRPRTTLILLVVVVAVASYIIYFEKDRPSGEERTRQAQNVVNFERDQLEGFVIHNGDDKIELRRTDDKWRLETPIKDQADRSMIDGLISDLEAWQKERTIPEKEIEASKELLAEYDLEKPKLRLKLLGKGMPPEILFGKDAALEGKMYVRFGNSKETYVTRQNVRETIAKKPEEFRDRKLTDIGITQITRAALKTPAGEMELEKKGAATQGSGAAGDAWEIVKPLRARGDNQKIGDLLAQVTSARIQQFVADDRGDLQPYGLAQPRGSITLLPRRTRTARHCKSAAHRRRNRTRSTCVSRRAVSFTRCRRRSRRS
jgi:hypothetical protein